MRMSQPGPPDPVNAARWRRWLFPSAVAAFFWCCWSCRAARPRARS